MSRRRRQKPQWPTGLDEEDLPPKRLERMRLAVERALEILRTGNLHGENPETALGNAFDTLSCALSDDLGFDTYPNIAGEDIPT